MHIVIQNNSGVSKKLLRFLKWKLYKLRRKFKKLLYVQLYIDMEGKNPKEYFGTARLGIKGGTILIKQKSQDPLILFHSMYKTAHLKLAEVHRRSE